ncbi:single-stranded DNA-binding protein [Alkaliphilus oremlandii]|uniref:Single-stranded DNA-binding protein n=1 Tax=Alkaliphilus oremlandii (strain OhILAs) TaxID=350688 RepID=A8MHY9_ALKOO|nr:single-stranded DNA-binding protein [Alkaliphilus oremlandii]ABW19421.1 single-strand binding protein [Alkaliphilus oremlandii OhILAs]
MNKVMLLGRLVKDVELRYSQGENPVAVGKYTLAVSRQFRKEGEPDADFINIIGFGKAAEFAEKYFKKGQQIVVVGRLQVRNYENEEGRKNFFTEVIVDEQYFAGNKKDKSSDGGNEVK